MTIFSKERWNETVAAQAKGLLGLGVTGDDPCIPHDFAELIICDLPEGHLGECSGTPISMIHGDLPRRMGFAPCEHCEACPLDEDGN